FPLADVVLALKRKIVLFGGNRHYALRIDGTAFGRTPLRQHEDAAGPAKTDSRPQSRDAAPDDEKIGGRQSRHGGAASWHPTVPSVVRSESGGQPCQKADPRPRRSR